MIWLSIVIPLTIIGGLVMWGLYEERMAGLKRGELFRFNLRQRDEEIAEHVRDLSDAELGHELDITAADIYEAAARKKD